jgi:hypothetical protein
MKIKLTLESLQVQTFATSGERARQRGTVHAHHPSGRDPQCYSHGTCMVPCTDTEHQTCEEGTCALTDYLPCCGG